MPKKKPNKNANVDLNDYATKEYVSEEILNVQLGGDVDLSKYATKEYVDENSINSQDILTEISIPGVNRYNVDNFMPRIFADPRSGNVISYNDNQNYYAIKIEVQPNTKYKYARLNSLSDQYIPFNDGFVAFLDKNEFILSYLQGGFNGIIETPNDCYYVVHTMWSSDTKEQITLRKPMFIEDYVFNNFEDMISYYIPYSPYQLNPEVFSTNFYKECNLIVSHAIQSDKGQWKDRIGVTYGDSITAINNDDSSQTGYYGDNKYEAWGSYVKDILGLKTLYGRGIGGQMYSWGNKGGGVSFINPDGSLHSRNDNSNFDDFNGTIPSGTVKVRGSLSSWSRITNQIPSSIKNEIDFIFIMGGSNDIGHEVGVEIGDATFIENQSLDTEWVNSSEYIGGDFNLNTYIGGLCSTIMKMQIWCPNAIIIVGTPLSGKSVNGSVGVNQTDFFKNTLNLSYIDYVEATLKATRLLSIPCIDVYGTTGINPFNRKEFIADLIHPYTDKGTKALARAVIGGMLNIYPNFK